MVDQGAPLILIKSVCVWGGGGGGELPLYHNFIFRIMRDQKQYVEKVILCTSPTLPYLCIVIYSVSVCHLIC